MIVDSLKNALLVSKTGLDEKLVSTDAISQMSLIADLLPTFPTASQAGLECHLGMSEPTADFFAAFSTLNSGREALARGYQPLANLEDNSVWNRVYEFCKHWTDKHSALYNEVDRVWLEFDLVKPQPSKVPEPNFFFGTAKGVKNEADDNLSFDRVSENYNWITEEALRFLRNKPLPDSIKQNLLNCFSSLPPGGRVFQLGVMLPRQAESETVRLCISNIAISDIPQYLKDIGWQGSVTKLQSVLADLTPFANSISLNIAVGDYIFPKIGLECYIEKNPKINPKWNSFLSYLVEQKLCTPEKADALLNYPGYSSEYHHQELWPRNLANASKFINNSFNSTLVRVLHHIKIVYQPERPLTAKAYLWFGHLWLPSRSALKK